MANMADESKKARVLNLIEGMHPDWYPIVLRRLIEIDADNILEAMEMVAGDHVAKLFKDAP